MPAIRRTGSPKPPSVDRRAAASCGPTTPMQRAAASCGGWSTPAVKAPKGGKAAKVKVKADPTPAPRTTKPAVSSCGGWSRMPGGRSPSGC